ncbi:hypothetical protein [uncultured Stenotrophomonas sp.]|uniref:hypothetical protein n=1 Tax=uncultured Stenotrophomonas sp. TaxID=165438 RepID=UPI0025F14B85|nr:hypothetical protein [uncultured Stenotrophomonas sp.]
MLLRSFATVVLMLGAAGAAGAAGAHGAEGLQGAWQLQSGEFINPEGKVVDYASQKLAGTKILADGRFAFTTTSDGKFWAGGSGTYRSADGHYVETPLMASYPLENGGSYSFRYTLEGDVWTLERWDGERRVEREVWKRAR